MRNRHDNIGAFAAHFRHVMACGLGNVVNGNFALQVRLIPDHDLRRHKADVANIQPVGFAGAIGHRGGFDQIRRKQRLVGFAVDDIGVHIREMRAAQRLVQVVEAIVEFVVAEVADAVIQGIHRFIHRMHLILAQPFRCHIIAERTALNDIAVVD